MASRMMSLQTLSARVVQDNLMKVACSDMNEKKLVIRDFIVKLPSPCIKIVKQENDFLSSEADDSFPSSEIEWTITSVLETRNTQPFELSNYFRCTGLAWVIRHCGYLTIDEIIHYFRRADTWLVRDLRLCRRDVVWYDTMHQVYLARL